jgi:hypothetical protein
MMQVGRDLLSELMSRTVEPFAFDGRMGPRV